jgi:hypothetical protein
MPEGSNFLTEKAGPLPTWGWLAIFTGVALVAYVYEKKKSSGSSTATSTTAQQQLLAAEEAAAANAANVTSAQTPNYNYAGNGSRMRSSGVYSYAPAASTTAPVASTAGTTTTVTPTTTTPTTPAGSPPPAVSTTPAPVASSNNTVSVPNCTGMDAGNAHNVLASAGLNPTAPPGQRAYEIVSGTSPAAGSQVQPGSAVTIVTTAPANANLPVQATTGSKTAGAGQTVVPNCAGQTAGTAHNMIVSAGLVPTAASGQKATTICKSTSPAAGSVVKDGSKVTIQT